jgi:hypothetical protein
LNELEFPPQSLVKVSDREVLDAALNLALDHGWFLYAIAAGTKKPLTEHGHHDASRTEFQIRKWWSSLYPGANVAVNLDLSGLLVLDLDAKNGATSIDAALRHGRVPVTMWERSGGGGAHYYYRRPAGSFQRVDLGGGVEILTSSAICTPSLHESGRRYVWCDAGEKLADAPAWITARARRHENPAPSTRTMIDPGECLTIADVLAAFPTARKTGSSWLVCCPAHDDQHPSCSLTEGEGGKPLVCCHAGCDQRTLWAAILDRVKGGCHV